MSDLQRFVCPWVRESRSYSDRHLDFAWKESEIRRMMSNENPFPPSDSLIERVVEMARKGNFYPPSGEDIRRKIGELNGLSMDNVFLGNGSTEVIDILIRTLVEPGDDVVIPTPTFGMYEARTRINGGEPVLVPLAEDFYWNIPGILEAIKERTKLIFICSPNNPTGNVIREADLRMILQRRIPTVIDEAYYELESECHSMAFLIKEFSNLIVVRTFSKAYGLAGFRVGYALADRELVKYCLQVKIPFNINLLAIAAILEALDNSTEFERKRQTIRQEREYLSRELSKIEGLRVFPSEGNFVLVNTTDTGVSSEEIVQTLLKEDRIFLRPMSFHGLKEGFLRVTVRAHEENRLLVETLRRFFSVTR